MSQWVFLQGLSDVWQPMLGYFTCTRNSVPSAHMHSLYLSKPSSKYTSPAELGIRVALNITDPLRTMLFSCKGTKQKPVRIMFVSLASHPPSHTKPYLQGRSNSWLTALSSMSPPILNSTVRPIMLTPSFPRMMALPSPFMFRSVAALLVIYTHRRQQTWKKHISLPISFPVLTALCGVWNMFTILYTPSLWKPFSHWELWLLWANETHGYQNLCWRMWSVCGGLWRICRHHWQLRSCPSLRSVWWCPAGTQPEKKEMIKWLPFNGVYMISHLQRQQTSLLPDYCCQREPSPGPSDLQLCFCAVGEQCPYLPSA